MAQMTTDNNILQRPLYLFDLPQEILYTLQLKIQPTTTPETPSLRPSTSNLASLHAQDKQNGPSSATSCNLCGLTFSDLLEQRSHVRSDLHGYNVKQKMRGNKPVNEVDFERLVGQLDESISGSDTSDSEDDSDDGVGGALKPGDTTLTALLKRNAKITNGAAEDAPAKKKRSSGTAPLIWFSTPRLPSNVSLGIYRAVFLQRELEREQEDKLVDVIKQKQLAPKPPPNPLQQKKLEREQEGDGGVPLPASMIQKDSSASGPHYFLCMIGGGHFAGMLVSLTPKLIKKAGIEDRSATVIAHKTFHRYTTRRKQGGSQSANDSSKGNAHSAGSSLRRYNETALVEEVRALLAEWRQWIDSSDLLFIRATGSTNRRTLFGPYEGQVLNQKDDRVRGFPFNTRRATQSELMRAFVELTRVKVNAVDEAELARKQAAENAAAAAKAEAVINAKPSTLKAAKPSKEDEEAALHTSQLQAFIRRSKAPGMLSYIQTNGLSPNFQFFPAELNHHAPTPLHLAAASNSPACISSLLVKASADPTIRNAEGKSAFDIAGDRPTRDAFRLARSQLGESRWRWDDAGVPTALSQADAEARTAREKEEKSAEEAIEKQRRQAETERLRNEDMEKEKAGKEKKFGKGHVMERPRLTAEERRMEQARGMTDEMRMRLEREKRARAAEERMKRLQSK